MSDQPPQGHASVSTPGSKSSREAELEELRRQSLAQSNAQKLAETGAAPVNMLDWQAQQKALKDQDRMSKTETAKFLQGYRGNTEIDSTLSSIKQQDRKAQEDAARLLHSYRGDARTPSRKTPTGAAADPNAVFGVLQADQRFGDESVASLAERFHQNGAQETPEAGTNMAEMMESTTTVDTPLTLSKESPVFVQESVAPLAAGFDHNGVQDAPAPATNMADESMVMVDTSPDESPDLVEDGKRNVVEDDWVSVVSSSVPSPDKVEDMRSLQSFDSADVSRAVTEIAGNIEDDDSDSTPLTEGHLHAVGSRGGHLSLRLDVEFSFCLISNDVHPNVDKYMNGVSAIAHTLFTNNRPAGRGGHAVYNADFQPFVRFVEDDAASPKSFIVHASLPMFILDWADAPSTRVGVRNALKDAIQDGRLLYLAHQ